MKTSESVKLISTDLVLAQDQIKHATKDAVNPHFRNNYATLESVIDATKAALLENNIATLQGMNAEGSALTTRLQHVSGEFFESEMKLVLSKQDMQGLGSAITYARRYALAAILNISQQDDDGNAASNRQSVPGKKSNGGPSAIKGTAGSQDEF
jgi:hypothetical protein